MGYWTIITPEETLNYIYNPGFEYDAIGASAATSWAKNVGTETFSVSKTYAHNGIRSLSVTTAATTDSGISQEVTVGTSGGTQYTASAWVRGTAGTVHIYIYDSVGGAQASATFTLVDRWTRIS